MIERANLFTDHRKSGRPTRAKYKHSRTIWEQLWTILPRISILLLWNDGHQSMELILCRVVESLCLFANSKYLSTHFLAWPSMWYDHEEIRRFSEYGNFSVAPAEILDSNMVSVIINNIFAYFTLSLSAIPRKHDRGMRLVLPNQLLRSVLSTSDWYFVSFQPIWCHPHTHIRIILFHDVQRDIPNLEFSPSHISVGFSEFTFPTTVLLNDDHTDFVQEGRLGLPCWTKILAICVVVDESKYLDIPIWEFSIILEHLPFLPGYKQILRQLLVLRNQAVLEMISMTFAAVIWDAEDPCSVNTA